MYTLTDKEVHTNLLIFVVDISRGMAAENSQFAVSKYPSLEGNGINAAKHAIEDVTTRIHTILEKSRVKQIEIAVLAFSENAEWVQLTDVKNLDAGGCIANFGAACEKLNDKLSVRNISEPPPAIIILASNEFYRDCEKELEILKNNEVFRRAIKEAIIFGGDTNVKVLKEFTGIEEIQHTYRPEYFGELVSNKSYEFVLNSNAEAVEKFEQHLSLR